MGPIPEPGEEAFGYAAERKGPQAHPEGMGGVGAESHQFCLLF